jgi:hypothetical protein
MNRTLIRRPSAARRAIINRGLCHRAREAKTGTGVEDRTLLRLFAGQRPSPEGDPGVLERLAPRAGFEPTHGLGNSQVPSQLGYLGMKKSFGDQAGRCLALSPRKYSFVKELEPARRLERHRCSFGPTRTGGRSIPLSDAGTLRCASWGGRSDLNRRRLVHSQPPETGLGYGHIWWNARESNPHRWFAGPELSP